MYPIIRIRGLSVAARIGVHEHEQGKAQVLSIDIDVEADVLAAAKEDRLSLTEDYSELATVVQDVCASRHHRLIESLAYDIAAALLARSRVRRTLVTVHKPNAIAGAEETSVSVELLRE